MDTAFRKIDIDQYDEDVLLDGELYDTDPRDPSQALSDVKQNAAAVRSSLAKYVPFLDLASQRVVLLLGRSDYVGALTLVLESAPYGPTVEEAKVRPSSSRLH